MRRLAKVQTSENHDWKRQLKSGNPNYRWIIWNIYGQISTIIINWKPILINICFPGNSIFRTLDSRWFVSSLAGIIRENFIDRNYE